jgi:hypothetical protein
MRTLRGLSSLATTAGAVALLVGAAGGCGPLRPCDDVSGSCLVLTIRGTGPYDTVTGALVGASGMDLQMGALASQPTAFPVTVRMVPPAGVMTSAVRSIRIDGTRSGEVIASGTTITGFSWPDGAHIEETIQLTGVAPGPPGPNVVWREEAPPAGTMSQLYDVWAQNQGGSSGDLVVAVGDQGTTLVKNGSQWVRETSMTTDYLAGVFADSSGSGVIMAVGQQPGKAAYRREGMPATWTKETMPAPMPGGAGFWAVAAGTAAGEYWAGDDDGKVWHRTQSGMTVMWTSEQVLPTGQGVYGIAQAGGAVFIVGNSGYVGYRPNSMAGTPWSTNRVSNISSSDWLNGVWAFDALSAVAVGTKGALVRLQNGVWGNTATKIDADNTELFGVWGADQSRIWVVGRDGTILRVDNMATTYKLHSKPGVDLQAVFGLGPTNLYAVGGSAGQPSLILHGTP